MTQFQPSPTNPPSPRAGRIAIFVPTMGGGGAEKVVLHLCGGLLQSGRAVDLLLKEKSGALLARLPAGVNVIDFQASSMSRCLPGLVRYLRQTGPEALVATMELPNLLSILAGQLAGGRTPVITTTHDTLSHTIRTNTGSATLDHILVWLLYRFAHRVVCVSRGVADDLATYAGLPRRRIDVIYNPVITPELKALAAQPFDHPWFAPGQPPVVLGVGRLVAQKDFATLLRAFALLRARTPARLVLLGEGEQRAELEALAERQGIRQDVWFAGFQANPFQVMSRAAVMVMSSLHEGFGMVLVEAMACGCPLVSTNCPHGPEELLDGGRYGHLVPLRDPAAMAEAVLAVLNGDPRRPPADWLRQFEVDSVTRQYLELIEGGA
ncbi:MAG: glycosyltransferase [Chloroflexi bacterium]|nr:glycosyltransferase [Chloroflexota bacterium]